MQELCLVVEQVLVGTVTVCTVVVGVQEMSVGQTFTGVGASELNSIMACEIEGFEFAGASSGSVSGS